MIPTRFFKNNLLISVFKNKKSLWLWFVLISFFILGFILRLECLEVVRINFWLTRDFDRAFNLFDGNYIPLAGPETTNGLRLPGPFLYFLMAVPLWFQYSYDSIFVFYFLLNISSLILTFWIIKKYFGFNTALLASIYQLVHPLSIEGVAFPINPAFLLPIIPFLFWFIFEFALNRNEKYFPLIILTIALGIQIHLSIAVFLIVPILWALIFKIKISLKTIIKTLIVIVLCFFPFYLYESQAYKPAIDVTSVTKPDPFASFIEPIKILGVQNTIWRLSEIGIAMGNMSNFLGVPRVYPLLTSILINGSLFGSFIFLFFRFKQKDSKSYKKLLLVVFLFYFPALIYDLIRPWEVHFWYNYIFIFPTALLLSNFLEIIDKIEKQKTFRIFSRIGTFVLIAFLALFNTNYFHSVKRDIQNHVSIGDYKSFYPLSLFIRSLLKHFSISPQDYIDRVYFEDTTPFSPKLIELIGKNNDSTLQKNVDLNKPCFYVFPMKNLVDRDIALFAEKNKRISSFSKDPTIQILPSETFSYNRERFGVKKYYPKFNQPCYQNSKNVFASSPADKRLLDDYFQFQNNGNRFLKKEFQFDKNGDWVQLKIKTIYLNPTLNVPIRFKIYLTKNINNYSLQVELDSYGWGKKSSDLFAFKKMDIEIENGKNLTEIGNKLKFPVISSGSWISEGFGIILEKFSWQRQFDLPIEFELPKDKLLLNVSGEFSLMGKKNSCCEKFSFPIFADLSKNSL